MSRTLIRILVAIGILGLAGLAARQAAVAAYGRTDPDLALRLDSGSAEALIARNDRELTRLKVAMLKDPVLSASATRALRAAPLARGALRQLGLVASAGGDDTRARKLMLLGNSISRRDFMLHVWMIEDRAAAGDIAGALDHYDMALSITDLSAPLLFPVLSAALDDVEIRAAFVRFLAQNRPWMPAFLSYAIDNGQNPQTIAALLLARGGMPNGAAFAGLESKLLKSLALKSRFEMAGRYARHMGFAAALAESGFNAKTLDPQLGPLGWELGDRPEARAIPDGADRLMLTASANVVGLAATRVLLLKPGRYIFRQTASPPLQGSAASWTWILRCLSPGDAANLMRLDSKPIDEPTRSEASVTVPANCAAQQLGVNVLGADTQGESGLILGPISITPAPAPAPAG